MSDTKSTLTKKIAHIINDQDTKYSTGYWIDMLVLFMILLSVLIIIFESVPEYNEKYADIFFYLDWVTITFFAIEFFIRWLTATGNKDFADSKYPRLKYFFSLGGQIDFWAFFPFLIPAIFGFDLRQFKLLRIFRIIRIFKTVRYSQSITILKNIFQNKKQDLIISMVSILFLLIIASSLMYLFEREVQPEHFNSIPKCLWWAAITATQVGYGDVVPISFLGRVIGVAVAFMGIGVFAIPAGIIAAGYTDEMEKRRKRETDQSQLKKHE
ncbi:MAG: ion transporter [Cyclobacteriaceae bacterium]|nr:ion transporter [Cyclobacteriaceae bacterium]MCH8517201.1 ion transporter [Cyclobacteriaceae bacterium]